MNRETVMAGIDRAAQLMNNDYFNNLVESKSSFGNKKRQGGSSDLAAFEAEAGFTPSSQMGKMTMAEDKQLPDFNTIKQSMRMNPTPVQQPQIIREVVSQPMQQGVYGNIDYNYIKYLVNECIRENLSAQLNESATINGVKLSKSGKIQFTDTKGNIYEGTLKLVGKIQ